MQSKSIWEYLVDKILQCVVKIVQQYCSQKGAGIVVVSAAAAAASAVDVIQRVVSQA